MSFPTYEGLCKVSQFLGMTDTTFCAEKFPFNYSNRTVAGQLISSYLDIYLCWFYCFIPICTLSVVEFYKSWFKIQSERKNSRGFIFIASLLFFIGVLFGYYIVTPSFYKLLSQLSNKQSDS